jgi:hypothetical protein
MGTLKLLGLHAGEGERGILGGEKIGRNQERVLN